MPCTDLSAFVIRKDLMSRSTAEWLWASYYVPEVSIDRSPRILPGASTVTFLKVLRVKIFDALDPFFLQRSHYTGFSVPEKGKEDSEWRAACKALGAVVGLLPRCRAPRAERRLF